MDDFNQPQIVWIELSDEPKFAYAGKITSVNTVFFMTGKNLLHLLGLLNSRLVTWYFHHCIGTTSGVGTNRWLKYTIEQIPMPPVDSQLEKLSLDISKLYDQGTDTEIDLLVCKLYGLGKEETDYIMVQQDDFLHPKIVWAELARTGNAFTTDFDCKTVGNTGYILTVKNDSKDDLYYLLGFLNSRILLYCLNQITSRFDENGWRWLRQFVEQLRIPKFIDKDAIVSIVKETNRYNQPEMSEIINAYVAKSFGLSEEELSYINRTLDGY